MLILIHTLIQNGDRALAVFHENHSAVGLRPVIFDSSQQIATVTFDYLEGSARETEVRIISARKATRNERKQYGEFL